MRAWLPILFIALSATACSGTPDADALSGADTDPTIDPPRVQDPEADPPVEAVPSADPGPPSLAIHVRANDDDFNHTDGLSGQTPLSVSGGVRSLRLYRDADDPTPVVLFDLGAHPVEVGYEDGSDTVVATLAASDVPAGHYQLARMVHTHSRYRIAGTMHQWNGSTAGVFDNLKVMSDGTWVDGAMRDAGYFQYRFEHDGVLTSGQGSEPIAPWSSTAGAIGVVEGGDWAVYFPIEIEIPADWTQDAKLVVDVNMHASFRWVDQPYLGYQPHVFDATPVSYEPVIRFGGNDFRVALEP